MFSLSCSKNGRRVRPKLSCERSFKRQSSHLPLVLIIELQHRGRGNGRANGVDLPLDDSRDTFADENAIREVVPLPHIGGHWRGIVQRVVIASVQCCSKRVSLVEIHRKTDAFRTCSIHHA